MGSAAFLNEAVTQMAELRSLGQQFYTISWNTPNVLQSGDSGEKVRHLQYMLSILSKYIPSIPSVAIDGIYGPNTQSAVLAAQKRFSLPETGTVNPVTWDAIYDQFAGIENTSLRNRETFPTASVPRNAAVISTGNLNSSPRTRPTPVTTPQSYNQTTTLTQYPGRALSNGSTDPIPPEVIR